MDDALCQPGIDPVTQLKNLAMANNGLVVFVVSTTGDGEVKKMSPFCFFLKFVY
jgi:Tfp pilus assembly ATPase PilU